MKWMMEFDASDRQLLLAGHKTPPGRYRELSSGRIVTLEEEDTLPASLDGRVACYVRLSNSWAQVSSRALQS